MKISNAVICSLAFLFLASVPLAAGADSWVPSDNMAVTTNNDCGTVSAVIGAPRVRRAFMSERERGLAAGLADRLRGGDEIEVPADGRLEWTSGKNIIAVLGPGARARVEGLRSFVGPGGIKVTRLDVRLLQGELRLQVRLNQDRPEAALVTLEGADALVERGDVALAGGGAWFGAALSDGDIQARLRRGGSVGAPFPVPEKMSIGSAGEGRLNDAAMSGIRARLPFSFELTIAALPPIPPLSAEVEALGP